MLESYLLQLQDSGILYILMAIVSMAGAYKCVSGMSSEPENSQKQGTRENVYTDVSRYKIDKMFAELYCYSTKQYRNKRR